MYKQHHTGQRKKSGIFSQKQLAKKHASSKASQKKRNKEENEKKRIRNSQKIQRDKHAQLNARQVSGDSKVSGVKKPKKPKKKKPKTDQQKKVLTAKVKQNRKKQLDTAKKNKYGLKF